VAEWSRMSEGQLQGELKKLKQQLEQERALQRGCLGSVRIAGTGRRHGRTVAVKSRRDRAGYLAADKRIRFLQLDIADVERLLGAQARA